MTVYPVCVPHLGESIPEATVLKWYKLIGDFVKIDEPIVELETEKVTLEVVAPSSGYITAIHFNPGSIAQIGAVLAQIEEAVAPDVAPLKVDQLFVTPAAQPTSTPDVLDKSGPAARLYAQENPNVLPKGEGSGRDGRFTKFDLSTQSAPQPPSPQTPPSAQTTAVTLLETPSAVASLERRVPMSSLRKTIATRLKQAQNQAAILTTFNEVNMESVMHLRTVYRDAFEKKHKVKLGFMSFFVKATLFALKQFPAINAQIEGNDIVYKDYYNIGVAVGTPKGLIVPILKQADQLSFAEIEKAIGHFGDKAKEGKLGPSDLSGGTFTISNGGIYGSLLSTPILNPPQSGILGMHKIQSRAMVMADGSIVAKPMMYLALSYDHRLVDGKEAVSFLVAIKDCLESPERLLFDV
jgi:2-oxoglutarate dehydrogenase E2 component (dihydrolipoamide succinyltransferase)